MAAAGLAALLVAIALLVAGAIRLAMRRSNPAAPTFGVPTEIDRSALPHPEAEQLVVVFTSDTCSSCAEALALAQEASTVPVVEASWERERPLHQRYRIGAVPTTLVVGPAGDVTASCQGPLDPSILP